MARRAYRKRSNTSRRKRSGTTYYGNYGYERAREHIREAREFSAELGGLDRDVKDYFFSLPRDELERVFVAYGRAFGADKEEYARMTFPRWKSGAVKMSGLVAKRLFSFLPPRMPIAKKYELAANVWHHFGPSSVHHLRIGGQTPNDNVVAEVLRILDENVTAYSVPENVRNRFGWLAGNDVELQEKLLNHFRAEEKNLANQKLSLELPVLKKQFNENPNTTHRIVSTLKINKHQLHVYLDPNLTDGIEFGAPRIVYQSAGPNWFMIIVGIVILLAILNGIGVFG